MSRGICVVMIQEGINFRWKISFDRHDRHCQCHYRYSQQILSANLGRFLKDPVGGRSDPSGGIASFSTKVQNVSLISVHSFLITSPFSWIWKTEHFLLLLLSIADKFQLRFWIRNILVIEQSLQFSWFLRDFCRWAALKCRGGLNYWTSGTIVHHSSISEVIKQKSLRSQ